MNKSSLLQQTLLAAALSTAAAGWLMAQADSSSPSQGSQRYGQAGSSSASSSQINKINKCSELIGMDVKNQQGEKLGEVKDVVIDFSGDRVGYVVLSADKGVLTTEQLHAVPLRAFQPSADGMSITLNADKDKLASSQGFSKDNWPSPSNPTWGAEPFWQEPAKSGSSEYKQQDRRTDNPSRSGNRSSTPPSPGGTTP